MQRLVGLLFHIIKTFVSVGQIGEFPYLGEKRPVIIASNHHSMKDAFIWGSVVPIRYPYTPAQYQGKPSLFENPVLSAFFRMIGIVPIERGSGKTLREILAASVATIEGGRSVFLFIEGGRSGDAIIQAGKPGVAYLGLKTGVPIVPVAISGTLHNRQTRGIAVGAPIVYDKVENPTRDAINRATDEIVAAIAGLQHKLAETL